MTDTAIPTSWDFESGQLPFRDQLFKTAIRMTRSIDDAEDLLQVTYLKAFKYYDGFEEGTNLKAWLFRIMKNNFINSYRKKKNRPPHLEFNDLQDGYEDVESGFTTAVSANPEIEFTDSEIYDEVRHALLALPHTYRMAVLMVDLQGFTYQEAADVLAVPLGTVMSRLYRGRKKLEGALLSYGRRFNYLDDSPRRLRNESGDRRAKGAETS